LHATPQVVPLQVAVPLATAGQGVQEVPQVAGAVLAAQVVPQR
jgi:hypothetical protein